MKLLIFNWKDIQNPRVGGAELFTHEVAKRWVAMGHDVTLFTAQFPHCTKEEMLDGIRIVRDGGKYTVYGRAKRFYRQLQKPVDVVIDEINTRPFFTPDYVQEPIVALIHQLAREYWFYETPFPLSYLGYYWLERRWLRKYINVPTITVSESTRQDLVELGFQDVAVVSEGLSFPPCENVPEKAKAPACIYVGRLTKAKQPHHLIDAFHLVKRDIPTAQLWFIGDGYMRQELERNASNDVTFFGHISTTKKIELLKRAWVLINPSIREGFGLNIIEANACGTPCIAYNVPGLKDTIKDGETGLLVKPNDIESLAYAIKKVCNRAGLRQKMSANGLRYSRQFSWDNTANDGFNIIKEIVKRHK